MVSNDPLVSCPSIHIFIFYPNYDSAERDESANMPNSLWLKVDFVGDSFDGCFSIFDAVFSVWGDYASIISSFIVIVYSLISLYVNWNR